MKAYFFGNMYLSSLQQGVQAAHCLAEMMVKYKYDSSDKPKLIERWAEDHKTIVLLNGGMTVDLEHTMALMVESENRYPWAYFYESPEALSSALTNVGIIAPEPICVAIELVRKDYRKMGMLLDKKYVRWNDGDKYDLTEWDIHLIDHIASAGLAR